MWKSEEEMFSLMRERLYTPVVGDILDVMGYSHQFLPAGIRPLKEGMKIAGKACTVLECDVFEAQEKPFGLLTEALDQLDQNEVYLATGAHNSAMWGELLTAAAKMRGGGWSGSERLYPGHASGTGPAIPCFFCWLLGTGLQYTHQCY